VGSIPNRSGPYDGNRLLSCSSNQRTQGSGAGPGGHRIQSERFKWTQLDGLDDRDRSTDQKVGASNRSRARCAVEPSGRTSWPRTLRVSGRSFCTSGRSGSAGHCPSFFPCPLDFGRLRSALLSGWAEPMFRTLWSDPTHCLPKLSPARTVVSGRHCRFVTQAIRRTSQ